MFDHTWTAAQTTAYGAVVILLVLAACASSADPSGPDSDVVSSGPLPYPSGSPSSSRPTNTVVPEPAVGLRKERWTQVAPLPGTKQISVSGTMSGGPPCAVLGRIDVEENAGQVTVTAWVGRRAGAECSGPQPDLGYPYVTTVTLQDPLGHRTVRDGAA